SFNGAASMRMRRGAVTIDATYLPLVRFNGAASMRMRRVIESGKLDVIVHVLQWGRIHADAEGNCAFPSGAHTRSFNGAASMRMRRDYVSSFGYDLFELQWGRIHADAE